MRPAQGTRTVFPHGRGALFFWFQSLAVRKAPPLETKGWATLAKGWATLAPRIKSLAKISACECPIPFERVRNSTSRKKWSRSRHKGVMTLRLEGGSH